jgi:hypothetical protein
MAIDRQFRVNYTSFDNDRVSAVMERALDRDAPVLLYRPAMTDDGVLEAVEGDGRVFRWIAQREAASTERVNEVVEENFERTKRAFEHHGVEYVAVVSGLDPLTDEFDPEAWTAVEFLTFVISLALMLVVLVAFTGPLNRFYERAGDDRFLNASDRLLEAAVVNRELHTAMFGGDGTSALVRHMAAAVETRTGRAPIVVTPYDVRLAD